MDDAVQDVIVAVLRRAQERDAVPSLYAYSAVLARNICLRQLSRNRRRRKEVENRASLRRSGVQIQTLPIKCMTTLRWLSSWKRL